MHNLISLGGDPANTAACTAAASSCAQFGPLPAWIADIAAALNTVELRLIMGIASYANGRTWSAEVGIARLAEIADRADCTVRRAVRRLADLGIWSIETGAGRCGVNVYTFARTRPDGLDNSNCTPSPRRDTAEARRSGPSRRSRREFSSDLRAETEREANLWVPLRQPAVKQDAQMFGPCPVAQSDPMLPDETRTEPRVRDLSGSIHGCHPFIDHHHEKTKRSCFHDDDERLASPHTLHRQADGTGRTAGLQCTGPFTGSAEPASLAGGPVRRISTCESEAPEPLLGYGPKPLLPAPDDLESCIPDTADPDQVERVLVSRFGVHPGRARKLASTPELDPGVIRRVIARVLHYAAKGVQNLPAYLCSVLEQAIDLVQRANAERRRQQQDARQQSVSDARTRLLSMVPAEWESLLRRFVSDKPPASPMRAIAEDYLPGGRCGNPSVARRDIALVSELVSYLSTPAA